MTENEKKPIKIDGGFFHSLSNEIKLVFRLLADPRVSWWLKLLPFASLVYFIFPDIAPGPIDDAVVIGVGVYLFVELCPPEIVEEHREALRKTIPGRWHDPEPEGEPDIVEGVIKEENTAP
ncbi:MAG: hypothetical protein FJ010_03430 [Chloroflexi bacterium]|nr:hypothetical protein [Chloroflexota bacterium]